MADAPFYHKEQNLPTLTPQFEWSVTKLYLYQMYWDRIFKRVWCPGIDSKEWIPPACVAWRAGTITLFLLGS